MAAYVLACMGLLAAGARGGGVLADGTAPAMARPAHATMHGDTVAVMDGATLRLDGHVVRLAGVAPPARGQDCAAGVDCGGRAALQLAALVRNRRVDCVVAGADMAGRMVATCEAGGTDIGQAVVASGWAQAAQAALKPAEARAQAAHLGLWR